MLAFRQNRTSFDISISSAQIVVRIDRVYIFLKNLVGKVIFEFLAIFICLPLVYIFAVLLRAKRKRLQKSMRESFNDFRDYEHYLKFKNSVHDLSVFLPKLKAIGGYNIKNAPLPIRFPLNQIKKMTSTLVTYNEWLDSRLTPLNEDNVDNECSDFKLITEKELWDNRNHAYQYWM